MPGWPLSAVVVKTHLMALRLATRGFGVAIADRGHLIETGRFQGQQYATAREARHQQAPPPLQGRGSRGSRGAHEAFSDRASLRWRGASARARCE